MGVERKRGEKMENQRIREAAAVAGVKLWQLAEAYGLSDGNFSRKLRHELPEEEQKRILKIIEELKKEDM